MPTYLNIILSTTYHFPTDVKDHLYHISDFKFTEII